MLILRMSFVMPLLIAGLSHAADVPGSRDHPLIKRYADSELYAYKESAFDEYHLMVKPATSYGGKEKNLESTLRLEGRVTERSYSLPPGRSTLEVTRNYQAELESSGFEILWQCSNAECGGRNFNHAVVPYGVGFGGNEEDQRFISARLTRPEGDIYASLYVVRNYSVGGPTRNTIHVRLDTIEIEAMESRMVVVQADEMSKGLDSEGRIALYGLYFDTDKAVVKPESDPTLQEIARLLKETPELTLWVVGHTDNQGTAEYNQDLSRRRAQAVAQALVDRFGIASARLQAAGVGFLSPVATNATEAGRALNRRVELVR